MANVGSSVVLGWLWRKQATEKGVTLKAKQDERTIASFWETQYPFSFENSLFSYFVACDSTITKAPSEQVFTVFKVYSTLKAGRVLCFGGTFIF